MITQIVISGKDPKKPIHITCELTRTALVLGRITSVQIDGVAVAREFYDNLRASFVFAFNSRDPVIPSLQLAEIILTIAQLGSVSNAEISDKGILIPFPCPILFPLPCIGADMEKYTGLLVEHIKCAHEMETYFLRIYEIRTALNKDIHPCDLAYHASQITLLCEKLHATERRLRENIRAL